MIIIYLLFGFAGIMGVIDGYNTRYNTRLEQRRTDTDVRILSKRNKIIDKNSAEEA